ncbi:MAG: sigma-70 family RNA polymerase sigma factor [Bacteroidota bacterium]|nr:sigma-70 family RNA polymerase sigma factor [Bacteroidota bacterium]
MLDNTSRKEAERALATSLQQGQSQVLALLYDAYAPVLLGLITRIVRNPHKAEMVLQETFLEIWQKRAAYNSSQGGLLTWMIMVAKEVALAALNNVKPGLVIEGRRCNAGGTDVKEKENSFTAEEVRLRTSFQVLAPNEKAALDLVYLKGYSCAEAAITLGISEEALKINLQMAIKHLRANQS